MYNKKWLGEGKNVMIGIMIIMIIFCFFNINYFLN